MVILFSNEIFFTKNMYLLNKSLPIHSGANFHYVYLLKTTDKIFLHSSHGKMEFVQINLAKSLD